MKVGDLVMLSAHGKTLVMLHHRKNKAGIIIHKNECRKGYSYKVCWLCGEKPDDGFIYHRRDLKHAKTTGKKPRYENRGSGKGL